MNGWRERSDRDFALPDAGHQPQQERLNSTPFIAGLALGAAVVGGAWYYLAANRPAPSPERSIASLKSWIDETVKQLETKSGQGGGPGRDALRGEAEAYLTRLRALRKEMPLIEIRRRSAEQKAAKIMEQITP